MFCTSCGVKLEPGNTFCTQCGAKTDDKMTEEDVITEHKAKEGIEDIELLEKEQEPNITFEPDESYLTEKNIVQEEDNFISYIISNQDEFANRLKDKFSYKKRDLIEALKERRKDAKALFQKATKKTKKSISKILEDEMDTMEEKLEKLKSIFQKKLLPEDEYELMREKVIHHCMEYNSVPSQILEDQMDLVETRLEKLKNMFERDLISESEYNTIRRNIIKI
mgnify:CR=1 FL=1